MSSFYLIAKIDKNIGKIFYILGYGKKKRIEFKSLEKKEEIKNRKKKVKRYRSESYL